MGVIWGKRDPTVTDFPVVGFLGRYRLAPFCLLCWHIPLVVEISGY
jgi:hypothetical protein